MKSYNILWGVILFVLLSTSLIHGASFTNEDIYKRVQEHYEDLSLKDIKKAMEIDGDFLKRSSEETETEGSRGIINADEIKTLYEFEKDGLIFEAELIERLNSTGVLSVEKAPNLIDDLNRIDSLLFGGRANDFPHAEYESSVGKPSSDLKNYSFSNPNGLTGTGELDEDLDDSKSALGKKNRKLESDAKFLQKSWQDGFVQNLPCTGIVKESTVLNMLSAEDFNRVTNYEGGTALFKKPGPETGGKFGFLTFKEDLTWEDFKRYEAPLEKLWQLNKKQGSYCDFYGWLKNYWADSFYPLARKHQNVKTNFLGKIVYVGGELLLSGNNYSLSQDEMYTGNGLRVDTYNLHPNSFTKKAFPGNPMEYPVREYPTNLTDYLFEDNSIAGNLAGIKSMFDMMNQFSLMAECTSRRLFQPPFIESEFDLEKIGKLKFHYLRKGSLPKSPSLLSDIQDDQVLDMFQGKESSLVYQASCEEKNQAGGGNSTQNAINSCIADRNRIESETEDEIRKKSFLKAKGHEMHSLVHSTLQMSYDFDVWSEDAEQFEKLMKLVAKKPKKY